MTILSRVNNLLWEARLGISTRGIVETDKPDACHYATVDYSLVLAALAKLKLQADDTFIDIGCGKGRVLCCAAVHRLRRVIGIEYSKALCEQAERNITRLRRKMSPVAIHHGSAEDFDYTDATALFMFNPFGAKTLRIVLERVRHDIATGARLAFINASPEQDSVLGTGGWRLYDRLKMADHEMKFLVLAE